MIFLGLILVAAAIGCGAAIVLGNSGSAHLDLFGQTIPGVTTESQVFMAGVVVAIVFSVGLTCAALGFGRSMRVRRELRDLRDENDEAISTLEMEKRQLQRELARARATKIDTPAARPAPTTDVPAAPRRLNDRRNAASRFFDQSA